MSYILDALKKAEADRKLGEAVSLHDPAPAPAPNWVEPVNSAYRPSLWLAAAGAMAACLLLAFWWWSSASDTESDASAGISTITTPVTPPVAPSPPIPRPDRARSQSAMNVAAVESPARPTSYNVQLPIPATATKPTRVTASAKANNKPASNDDTSAAAALNQVEPLTAAIRQQLPPLAVSGAMYADAPANRMVVINGEVLHEGDAIAPGLVLERIALKAATIRYKGKAYLLTY